jgi:hypothetical protein
MRPTHLLLLALAAGLASTTAAHAQSKPYGAGFDGWTFTVTTEKPGLINCRAIRKVGGREDIISMHNDSRTPYLSVKAEGRKGKWPGTIINIPGKYVPGQFGQFAWKSPAEANGVRMWFPLEAGAINLIAAAGAYEWSLTDTEDSAKVNLGKRAADAWERVNICVHKNGK